MGSSHELTQFERAVMQKLLFGDHPVLKILRTQLENSIALARQFTGVGMYVTFAIADDVPRAGKLATTIGDVGATIPGLECGLGFVLFIQDGKIDMLEAYTYDEPWPQSISNHELAYANGKHRDLEGLRKQLSMQ